VNGRAAKSPGKVKKSPVQRHLYLYLHPQSAILYLHLHNRHHRCHGHSLEFSTLPITRSEHVSLITSREWWRENKGENLIGMLGIHEISESKAIAAKSQSYLREAVWIACVCRYSCVCWRGNNGPPAQYARHGYYLSFV